MDAVDNRPAVPQNAESRPFRVERRQDGSINIQTPNSNWVVRKVGDRDGYAGRVVHTEGPSDAPRKAYYEFSVYGYGDKKGVVIYESILTPEQERLYLEGTASQFSMQYRPINLETVDAGKPGCNEGVNWNYTVKEVIGREGLCETEDFKGTGYEDFRKILYKLRATRPYGA